MPCQQLHITAPGANLEMPGPDKIKQQFQQKRQANPSPVRINPPASFIFPNQALRATAEAMEVLPDRPKAVALLQEAAILIANLETDRIHRTLKDHDRLSDFSLSAMQPCQTLKHDE